MTGTDRKVVRVSLGVCPSARRQIVVQVGPDDYLYLREKGRRYVVTFDLHDLYVEGVRRRTAAERLERKKRKQRK